MANNAAAALLACQYLSAAQVCFVQSRLRSLLLHLTGPLGCHQKVVGAYRGAAMTNKPPSGICSLQLQKEFFCKLCSDS